MFQIVLTALFMFFLPGYTLINAIYPGKGQLDEKLDIIYRLSYSVGLSVAIVIILGFILGNYPVDGDQGLFVAVNIWFGLILLTTIFFFIGWYRGAYQRLRFLSDKLVREPPKRSKGEERREEKKLKELEELARKRSALRKEIKSAGKADLTDKKEELSNVEDKLKELEKKREEEL